MVSRFSSPSPSVSPAARPASAPVSAASHAVSASPASSASSTAPHSLRPLRVGVVGAGPAGVYVSDILVRQLAAQGEALGLGPDAAGNVRVDLIERLPVPFGLVRYGVAPDHPAIKWIMAALEKAISRPQIHLVTGVAVGGDVSVPDLLAHEDLVIFATGARRDRVFDVPGADAPQVHGAARFVEWYDGYPTHDSPTRVSPPHGSPADDSPADGSLDASGSGPLGSGILGSASRSWDLSATDVAVIGGGNVALDVTRILAEPAQALRSTDIPEDVEKALESSGLRTVHIFVRRGPAQAKFSVQELRQLEALRNVRLRVDATDFDLDPDTLARAKADHETSAMLDELLAIRDRAQADAASESAQSSAASDPAGDSAGSSADFPARTVWFHFYSNPDAVLTNPSDSAAGSPRVRAIRVRRTSVDPSGALTLGDETREYPVQAVYTAIGYQPARVPGVPYDSTRLTLANRGGRIVDAVDGAGDCAVGGAVGSDAARDSRDVAEDGSLPAPLPREYATGWAKRGPVGLIGSTKADAKQTVAAILQDCSSDPRKGRNSQVDDAPTLQDWLRSRNIPFGTLEGWKRVDAAEKAEGARQGRPRGKIVSWEELVRLSETVR